MTRKIRSRGTRGVGGRGPAPGIAGRSTPCNRAESLQELVMRNPFFVLPYFF